MSILGGIAQNVIGTAISQGLGLSMSPGQAMNQSWEYQKQAMGLQYQYGQKAAEAQQKRNMEMWKATNYEAQREHMENAGLSVGLMYGNGGAQAASTAGGNPTQPDGMAQNPVTLGLQAQSMQSQINLANAEASKAYAEAEKISGVDTEKTKKDIEEADARIQREAAEWWKLGKEADVLDEKWKQEQNNTYISEQTKYDRIDMIKQELYNKREEMEVMKADIALKNSNVNLNDKQAQYLGEKIKYYAKEIQAKVDTAQAAKDQAQNAADAIRNDKELRGTGLDIQTGNIIADAIISLINIGVQLYGGYKNRQPTNTTTSTTTTKGKGVTTTTTHSTTGK